MCWRKNTSCNRDLSASAHLPINTQIISATDTQISYSISHSTLSSEILIFYYSFSFPFLMAEWNPGKQTLLWCKHPPKPGNFLTAFDVFHHAHTVQIHRNLPGWDPVSGASTAQKSEAQTSRIHGFQKTWDFTVIWYLCNQPTPILLPPNTSCCHKALKKCLLNKEGQWLCNEGKPGQNQFSSRSKLAACGEVKTQPLHQTCSLSDTGHSVGTKAAARVAEGFLTW